MFKKVYKKIFVGSLVFTFVLSNPVLMMKDFKSNVSYASDINKESFDILNSLSYDSNLKPIELEIVSSSEVLKSNGLPNLIWVKNDSITKDSSLVFIVESKDGKKSFYNLGLNDLKDYDVNKLSNSSGPILIPSNVNSFSLKELPFDLNYGDILKVYTVLNSRHSKSYYKKVIDLKEDALINDYSFYKGDFSKVKSLINLKRSYFLSDVSFSNVYYGDKEIVINFDGFSSEGYHSYLDTIYIVNDKGDILFHSKIDEIFDDGKTFNKKLSLDKSLNKGDFIYVIATHTELSKYEGADSVSKKPLKFDILSSIYIDDKEAYTKTFDLSTFPTRSDFKFNVGGDYGENELVLSSDRDFDVINVKISNKESGINKNYKFLNDKKSLKTKKLSLGYSLSDGDLVEVFLTDGKNNSSTNKIEVSKPVEENISFETIYKAKKELPFGKAEVFQKGELGKKLVKKDGSYEVIKKPVSEIIYVGNVDKKVNVIKNRIKWVASKDMNPGSEKTDKGFDGYNSLTKIYDVDPKKGLLDTFKENKEKKDAKDTIIYFSPEKITNSEDNSAKYSNKSPRLKFVTTDLNKEVDINDFFKKDFDKDNYSKIEYKNKDDVDVSLAVFDKDIPILLHRKDGHIEEVTGSLTVKALKEILKYDREYASDPKLNFKEEKIIQEGKDGLKVDNGGGNAKITKPVNEVLNIGNVKKILDEDIDYKTKRVFDKNLEPSSEKVVIKGKKGSRVVNRVYKVDKNKGLDIKTYEDKETLVEAIDEVIHYNDEVVVKPTPLEPAEEVIPLTPLEPSEEIEEEDIIRPTPLEPAEEIKDDEKDEKSSYKVIRLVFKDSDGNFILSYDFSELDIGKSLSLDLKIPKGYELTGFVGK